LETPFFTDSTIFLGVVVAARTQIAAEHLFAPVVLCRRLLKDEPSPARLAWHVGDIGDHHTAAAAYPLAGLDVPQMLRGAVAANPSVPVVRLSGEAPETALGNFPVPRFIVGEVSVALGTYVAPLLRFVDPAVLFPLLGGRRLRS